MLIPALRHHGLQKEVGRPPFLKLGLFEEAEASGRHRRKLSGDVWSRILQRDGDAIKMGPPGDGVSAQPDPVASTSFHGLPAAPPTAGFQKVVRKKGPKIPRKKGNAAQKQPAKINARGKTPKTACAVKTISALAKNAASSDSEFSDPSRATQWLSLWKMRGALRVSSERVQYSLFEGRPSYRSSASRNPRPCNQKNGQVVL